MPYRRLNLSTRPAVSTNFCSPVKKGWQAAQMPILRLSRVERVRYAAPQAAYGARARFLETAWRLRADGWPVLDGPARWRLGELGVRWEAVSPR